LKELAKVAEFGFADSEFNRSSSRPRHREDRRRAHPLRLGGVRRRAPTPAVTRILADERTSILAVGQILPQKAIHDVIAGIRALPPARRARLYLVGSTAMSGSYLERLRKQVADAGLMRR